MIGARGVGVRVFGLAGNVLLARMLLPSEFGTVALALSLLALGGVIFDGGLGASLIRRSREPTTEELRNVAATLEILDGATSITVSVMLKLICRTVKPANPSARPSVRRASSVRLPPSSA